MRGVSCSDDQWIKYYYKMSFSYNSRNLGKKKPPFIDIHKELSNIFLTRGQPFWDNKRFKCYVEKR